MQGPYVTDEGGDGVGLSALDDRRSGGTSANRQDVAVALTATHRGYALANRVQHPRNVYLPESWVVPPLDDWLAKVFLPHRLDDTIDLMATAAAPNMRPQPLRPPVR